MGGAPARLKTRRDFLRVAATRKKWVTPGFILQIAPAPKAASAGEAVEASGPRESVRDTAGLRVGFTTSRKVGNAVKRNRARRRLRAVADQILPQYAKPGFDYVLIGRADATVALPFDQMLHDLRWALKRLGALRGPDENATATANGNKVAEP